MKRQKLAYLDFETQSACNLKRSGSYVYSKHPTTNIMCTAVALDEEPCELFRETEGLERMEELLEKDYLFVAHNASFEYDIWNNVCVPKYGWPKLPREKLICTMAIAYSMGLPGSLDGASGALGIKEKKDLVGQKAMMKLCQPKPPPRGQKEDPFAIPTFWKYEECPDTFETLYRYCPQDVVVCREFYKRAMKLSPSEWKLWILDHHINQRGIRIDVAAAYTAFELLQAEKKFLDNEMREVTKGGVATATAVGQLAEWLAWQGIATDGLDKSVVTELLAREDIPDTAKKALRIRQKGSKTSTAKLNPMLQASDPDDHRVRGTLQFYGAGTGRWAGRLLQTHNFPRPKISQEDIEGVFDILSRVS